MLLAAIVIGIVMFLLIIAGVYYLTKGNEQGLGVFLLTLGILFIGSIVVSNNHSYKKAQINALNNEWKYKKEYIIRDSVVVDSAYYKILKQCK